MRRDGARLLGEHVSAVRLAALAVLVAGCTKGAPATVYRVVCAVGDQKIEALSDSLPQHAEGVLAFTPRGFTRQVLASGAACVVVPVDASATLPQPSAVATAEPSPVALETPWLPSLAYPKPWKKEYRK